jgi:hypothetical protein
MQVQSVRMHMKSPIHYHIQPQTPLIGSLQPHAPLEQAVKFGNLGKAIANAIDTGYSETGQIVHNATSKLIEGIGTLGKRIFVGPTQAKIVDKVGDVANGVAILSVPAAYFINPAMLPHMVALAVVATALNAGKNHRLP